MAAARREDQEQFPAPPIVLPPYFVPLSTPKELAAEGHTLRNCVGGYAGKVRRSKCYVFKLEAPERATVSLVSVNGRWKLGEIKGPRNREVRWDTKEFVAEWIERSQNGKAESFPMPDHEFPEIANFRPIAFTPAPLSPPAQLEPITSSVRLLNRPGVPRDRMEDLIEDLRCRGAYGNPSCEAYAFNLSAPVSATVILGTRKGTDGEICWEISEIIPHGNDQITWDIYESVRAAVEYEGNSPSLLNEPTKHQSIQLTL